MKRLFNLVCMIVLVFTTLAVNTSQASAATRPVLSIPVPVDKVVTVKFSQGQHISEIRRLGANGLVLSNAGTGVKSSVDLSYLGKVLAPMKGTVKVFADCGSGGQILFIWDPATRFAIVVAHIKAVVKHNAVVTQGQYIGDTIAPQNNNCGRAPAHHIHLTLLTSSDGRNFAEQDITGTQFGQWRLNTDRSLTSVLTGRVLWDYLKSSTQYYLTDTAKITSVRSGKVIDAYSAGTQIWTYSAGNRNQQWILLAVPNDPGYYYLKSVSRGQCMVSPSTGNGALIGFSACWQQNQKFKFEPISNLPGKYAIRSRTSGRVLDVLTNWSDPNSGKANGTRIQQWDAFYGNNQQWTFSKP